MKCLRCGREIGNNEECVCGHFYETNLKKRNIIKKVVNKENVNITVLDKLIIVLSVLFVISYILFFVILIEYHSSTRDKKKKDEFCTKLCRSNEYNIENNKCYCSNGEIIDIN